MFIYGTKLLNWAIAHCHGESKASGKPCWVFDCGGFFYIYRENKPDETRWVGKCVYESQP